MKKVQTHMTYGLVTGLALVVLGLILHVTKMSMQSWAQWLSSLGLLIGLILNARAYSKANEADITFGNAFSSGFKMTLIVAVISTVWIVIAFSIFPEMKEMILEKSANDMAARGMSDEDVQQGMKMTEKFTSVPIMAAFGFLGTVFMGTIFSLIAGAVAKKNPRPQIQDHL